MQPVGSLWNFLDQVVRELVSLRGGWRLRGPVLIGQIYFTGVEALALVLPISLMLGAFVILAGNEYLAQVGRGWIYQALVSAVVRDLAPLITGVLVLLRSGTAISTELGNMVVNREVESLRSLGISPISYLVAPRIVGVIFSVLLLSVYFAFFGVFGGYVVADLVSPLPFAEFMQGFSLALGIGDIALMLGKALFSGLAVGVICCFQGLRVERAATEVPQRNIKAVTHSLAAVLAGNVGWIILFLSA